VRLGRWRYTAVAWATARRDLLRELAADPRATVLQQQVAEVRDGDSSAGVLVQDGWRPASWVYDSRPAGPDPRPSAPPGRGPLRPVRLVQAFRGVWVETAPEAGDVVDTSAATLLDFSTDDGPDLGFSYVLPVTTRTALVMAVRMGVAVETPDPVPAVARVVGGSAWQAVAEEHGVTPLLSPPRPRREGNRLLAIGVRGGRARPSTGYAVTRIEADAAATVRSLRRNGHPFGTVDDTRGDQVLDAIWLHALAREGAGLEPAFLRLFTRAPVDSVLRFLDGQARARDTARVVAALPKGPFLRALAAADDPSPSC
jgi:lycopene beta-cyclase